MSVCIVAAALRADESTRSDSPPESLAQSQQPGFSSKDAAGKQNEFSITERGPNHRVWERIIEEKSSSGRVYPRKSSYVELATGLHWKENPADETEEWKESVEKIEPAPGGGSVESTDECLNTIVNALSASERANPRSCQPRTAPLQINDFNPGFRSNAQRLVVLITDAPPGGFCDSTDTGSPTQARQYAFQARNECIRINAIQAEALFEFDPNATPFMEDYAELSCGWYAQVPQSGVGVAEVVLKMFYAPGACSCP